MYLAELMESHDRLHTQRQSVRTKAPTVAARRILNMNDIGRSRGDLLSGTVRGKGRPIKACHKGYFNSLSSEFLRQLFSETADSAGIRRDRSGDETDAHFERRPTTRLVRTRRRRRSTVPA